jgi:Biotin-requiring enzyme
MALRRFSKLLGVIGGGQGRLRDWGTSVYTPARLVEPQTCTPACFPGEMKACRLFESTLLLSVRALCTFLGTFCVQDLRVAGTVFRPTHVFIPNCSGRDRGPSVLQWMRAISIAQHPWADISVLVPSMGDSITEGTIAALLKQPGDFVDEDEPIAQVETDKVTIEVRAPVAGVRNQHTPTTGENSSCGDFLLWLPTHQGQGGVFLDVDNSSAIDSTGFVRRTRCHSYCRTRSGYCGCGDE